MMARFLHSSASSRSATMVSSLCVITYYYLCVPFVLLPTGVMAWSPLPSSASFINKRAASATIKGGSVIVDGTNFGGVTPLFSTVDELYYNPTTSSSSSSSSIFDTSSSSTTAATSTTMATSEEMEMAAQNYGNGDVMNINPQQKITLTRWLSAKVQDYPEVSSL
jgi:hypothetical protein